MTKAVVAVAPTAFAPAIAATATAPPVVFSFLWASMSNTVALFGLLVYAAYDLWSVGIPVASAVRQHSPPH